MCKPSCAIWGLGREEVCPDCLLDLAKFSRDESCKLRATGHALKLAIQQCPPFRFLRLQLAALMRDDAVSSEYVVDWVHDQCAYYPAESYAGGAARSFTLSPEFVSIGGRNGSQQ